MSTAPSEPEVPEIPATEPCRLCRAKGRLLDGKPIIKRWAPGGLGSAQVYLVCDINPIDGLLGAWGDV